MAVRKGIIVRTLEQFKAATKLIPPAVAADVETYKQRPTQPGALLLGLALSWREAEDIVSIYIPIHHYNPSTLMFDSFVDGEFYSHLAKVLDTHGLVGWNVPFDKSWLDSYFKLDTKWIADGRIYWHLQNNDIRIRGYGLKLAQKILLGWSQTNEEALEANVKAKGGRLRDGDHYLADLDVLSHYAALDTASTWLAYEHLCYWMDFHDYRWFAAEILAFSIRLQGSSAQGFKIDEVELATARDSYAKKRKEMDGKVREVCKEEIEAIEGAWKERQLGTYKTLRGRQRFLENQARWRRFNPSSTQQRATLLHTVMGFEVLERTPTGLPKTDRANLSQVPHDAGRFLVEYSEAKKMVEAATTYLEHTEGGRLHTNYDVCGTVTGRLSGFKPSVLNMPFSEMEVMNAFKADEGYIGIHADLAAIEPCVLAHYSEDSTLLKVYKEGKGDIYLDLALDIFPERTDLRECYDSSSTNPSDAKAKFKDLRAVCKIIHLAVSYTGTRVTVSKNLSKAGFITSQDKAGTLVWRYWQKFSKVKEFNAKLHEIYKSKGHIRNLVGRVIQVPREFEKDLMNRLIQSSAHDILRLWCMEIVRLFNEAGVDYKYWLPDIHDSTTFQVRPAQKEMAAELYMQALRNIEQQLGMSVPLKAELKFCVTLAGLKGE